MMNRFGAQRPYTPPEAVLDIFRREFEGAHAEGGLFLLTMHPHVIGYRCRMFILDELLDRIAPRAIAGSPHMPISRATAPESAGLKGQP